VFFLLVVEIWAVWWRVWTDCADAEAVGMRKSDVARRRKRRAMMMVVVGGGARGIMVVVAEDGSRA